MSKIFDFVTIGAATRDIFFKTDRDWVVKNEDPLKQRLMCFEYGAKVIPKDAHFAFGGGAANTAISISRLGLRVSAIASLNEDETADAILKHLKTERVKTNLAISKGHYRTGLSVIIVDKNGDHTAILYRGTNNNLSIKNWDFLEKTKWIYMSSLTGKSELVLNRLERELFKCRTKFAWNPGGTQLKKGYEGLKKLISQTDALILNKDEAAELVSSKDKKIDCQNINSLIYEIKHWGSKIVIITDGANGAFAFDGKVIYQAKTVKAKVIDTTGAGDAFGSSFVAGLEILKDTKKALALATINASSVVSHYGAQAGLLPLYKVKGLNKVKVLETIR